MKSSLRGVITALVTPFFQGAVDKKSFVKILQAQLEAGVEGFVVNGTTGESPVLKFEEVKELFEIARVEAGGKVPLIVGTGLNSTEKTCEFSEKVSAWKPDALLVVVPYYNKPPQRGLLAHFSKVAESSRAPILLYNVPGRTVAGLEAATVGELSRHSNIIGIKEATGNLQILADMQAASAKDFIFLSGDDASCVDFCGRGGHGVISVSSHIIGGEMVRYVKAAQARDQGVVLEYADQYKDLMKWLYIEANPIPVKMAVHMMGLTSSAEMRLPLSELDPRFHKDLKACLEKLGKI